MRPRRSTGRPPRTSSRIEDIRPIVRKHSVDRVVVSLADARGKLPMAALLQMRLNGVYFDHLASVYEQYTGKIAVENLRPSWLILPTASAKRGAHHRQRTTDIVCSSLALDILSPRDAARRPRGSIQLRRADSSITSHASDRTDASSTCTSSDRCGRTPKPQPVRCGRQKGDSRITPICSILRRTRLDELPQLWNILCGDMSLVGRAPERPAFVAALSEQIPFYAQRLMVKPGLTGMAQVRYSYASSVEDTMEKLQYRPVLHQEHVDRARPHDHARNRQDVLSARHLDRCRRISFNTKDTKDTKAWNAGILCVDDTRIESVPPCAPSSHFLKWAKPSASP